MATTAQETEQITRTINQYVEGVRDGDSAKLRDVFHPDTRMWGSMLGQRYDEPITELFKLAESGAWTSSSRHHMVADATAATRQKSSPSSRTMTSRW